MGSAENNERSKNGQGRFLRRAAESAPRKQLAEHLYDDYYKRGAESKAHGIPAKRRVARIARYRAIIDRGHRTILELGCGVGVLSYGLIECAETVVGTDISANAIQMALAR